MLAAPNNKNHNTRRTTNLAALTTLLLTSAAYATGPIAQESPISVDSNENFGNQAVIWVGSSPNGRYVAFTSRATNLVVPDNNGPTADLFLRDRVFGTTTRIGTSATGAQDSFSEPANPFVGASGAYVAFSTAAAWDPIDTNSRIDIYVKAPLTGAVVPVSVDSNGVIGDMHSTGASLSYTLSDNGNLSAIDGRYVCFTSRSTNLVAGDTNNAPDVFRHDRDADGNGLFDEPGGISTIRVSVDNAGLQANTFTVGAPTMSADGNRIAWWDISNNLVPNDTNFQNDVFVRDIAAGTTTRVSVSTAGVEQDEDHTLPLQPTPGGLTANISGDGNHVAFYSRATNLVPGDTNNQPDVFVRDLTNNTTVRVSVTNSGAQATGGGSFTPRISYDGRFVTFITDATNMPGGAVGSRIMAHDRDTDEDGVYDEPGATQSYLVEVTDPNPAPGFGAVDSTVSPSGSNIFYTSTYNLFGNDLNAASDVYMEETILDTDKDAILDAWEHTGIDWDGDGELDSQTFLPTGTSDPFHKDLYIEIDAMVGRAPAVGTLNVVGSAFFNAPVPNPDGVDGINFRTQGDQIGVVLLDETNIPLAGWTWNPPTITWPPEFATTKTNFFGTVAERADPNWTNIRAAKEMVYRYCVYADQLGTTTVSGVGEFPGDDTIITLGAWTPAGGRPGDQQGLLMHEIGHNLGLDHGGCDPINYKPNYNSVMNYTWTVPPLTPPNNLFYWQAWKADYSHSQWPTLDENNLDETQPISNDLTHSTDVVPTGPPAARFVFEAGVNGSPIDWDRDGSATNTSAVANVNYILPNLDTNGDGVINTQDTMPGEVLVGHDDWANINLAFTGCPNFEAGVSGYMVPSSRDMTYEELEMISGIGACEADLDGDGQVGSSDLAQLIGLWGQTGVPADFDGGGVGSSDLATLIGNWGPC